MAAVTYPFPIPHNSPFTLRNIPFGVFSTSDHEKPRLGVALGDWILDLQTLCEVETSFCEFKDVFAASTLNEFASLPKETRSRARKIVQVLIQEPTSSLYSWSRLWTSRADAIMHHPFYTRGFSDFMCSLEHVSNVGRTSGHPQPPPNFFNLPVGYNGRSSSIIVSGTPLRRPWGVLPRKGDTAVNLLPTEKLDFEMELGVFIAGEIPVGETIPATLARDHIFGFVLLNDWSSRDIQFYEMLPLGPFNGKSSGTSISPWVVTLDALQEAGALVAPSVSKPAGGKASKLQFFSGAQDIAIEVSTFISRGQPRVRTHLCTSNSSHLHWSPFQMLAYHSLAGCGFSSGDLIGTGTISSSKEQASESGNAQLNGKRVGCLQELTVGGTQPITLDDGSSLTWLEDDDEVIMEGWAGQGLHRIGFGELTGRVASALQKDQLVRHGMPLGK